MEIELIKCKDIRVGDVVKTQENYANNRGDWFEVEARDLVVLNPTIPWVRKRFEPIPHYLIEEDNSNSMSTTELFNTVLYWSITVTLWSTYWWVVCALCYISESIEEGVGNIYATYIPMVVILFMYIRFLLKTTKKIKSKLI